MQRWDQLMGRLRPRKDLQESFYPDHIEHHKPVLLTASSAVVAACVGARVLRVLATRGGTRIKTSALDSLLGALHDALPTEVRAHADEESARVLHWLEETLDRRTSHEQADDTQEPGHGPKLPDLEIMESADLESRITVAQFALREGLDLELEYYRSDEDRWPRLRATPVAIEHDLAARDTPRPDFPPGTEGSVETTGNPRLILNTPADERLEVELRAVRWLMPVSRLPEKAMANPAVRKSAKVLSFPATRKPKG